MSTALRFTVAEFDRMIEQGIFNDRPEQRLELIHGEIREMPPPNPPHEYEVDLLMYWSIENTSRDDVHVRIQNSLGIPALDSVTIPDVAWMRAKDYRRVRPKPGDVLLLIAVSETTLAYDRGEKADLYADAGIKDYWIINVLDLCVEVHRKPRGGTYRAVSTFRIGQSVSPLAAPSVELNIAQLFGQ